MFIRRPATVDPFMRPIQRSTMQKNLRIPGSILSTCEYQERFLQQLTLYPIASRLPRETTVFG